MMSDCSGEQHPPDDWPMRGGPRREPLVVLVIPIAAGVYGSQQAWMSFHWAIALTIGCLVLSAIIRRRRFAGAGCGLLALAAFSAAYTHHCSTRFAPCDVATLATRSPTPLVIEGTRAGSVSYRRTDSRLPWSALPSPPRARFLLRVDRVRIGRRWRPACGKLLVEVKLKEQEGVTESDEFLRPMRLWGELGRFERAKNPGNHSSREYWRAYRVRARFSVASTESIRSIGPSHWGGVLPRGMIERARMAARLALRTYVPPDQQGLAVSIVLGDRGELEEVDQRAFRATGTAHLLAVSGMHVAVALAGWWWFLRVGWLPRRHVWWGTLAVAVCYALFTGGQPPVWRATLLLGAWLGAARLGRIVAGRQLLALVAILMWCWRPLSWTQGGVWLSFAAVGGLMWWSDVRRVSTQVEPLEQLLRDSAPRWRRVLDRCRKRVAEGIGASVAVVVVTAPLVWHLFHSIPLAGVLLSPVLAVVMAVALWTGLLSAATAWLMLPGPAGWCGMVCGASLQLAQRINQLVVQPFPALELPPPPDWFCSAYYVLFALLWIVCRRAFALRRGVALTATYFLVARLAVGSVESAEFEAVFFSVGHGTCVWVHTSDGRDWLYDAGTMGDPRQTTKQVARSLRFLGVRRLDGVFVSHADADHFNLVPHLAGHLPVTEVVVTPAIVASRSRQLDAWFDSLHRQGIRWRVTRQADQYRWPHLSVRVLNATPTRREWSDNETSLVLLLEQQAVQIVLPGDVEGKGLEMVWPQLTTKIDRPLFLLMAPHHGSRHSLPGRWLADFSPRHIVVSGSRRSADASCRRWRVGGRAQVWHTARGAVRVRCVGGTWRVEQWDGGEWKGSDRRVGESIGRSESVSLARVAE